MDNKKIKIIKLNESKLIPNDLKVLDFCDLGALVREDIQLSQIEKRYDVIQIEIPKKFIYVSHKFIAGLLQESFYQWVDYDLDKIEERFNEKYKFDIKGETEQVKFHKEHIDYAIESCLNEVAIYKKQKIKLI